MSDVDAEYRHGFGVVVVEGLQDRFALVGAVGVPLLRCGVALEATGLGGANDDGRKPAEQATFAGARSSSRPGETDRVVPAEDQR